MADALTIEGIHEGIKQALAEAFPQLVTVDDYPTEEGHIKTPAAFLNLSAIEPDSDGNGEDGTERLAALLRWEISLVLGLPTQATKRAARALAASVAVWVQGARFGLCVGRAQFIRAEQDEFSPVLGRHTPWVVEFELSAAFGASVWDEDSAPAPSEVYLGFEPDTGAEHLADYVLVNTDELPAG